MIVVFKRLLEQFAADPDTDTGTDHRDKNLAHKARGTQADQTEQDVANKTAQDTQHDVAHGRCLTAHDAASNGTGQSTDQQTENKTKHCNAS